jgi:hypothetical protein
MIFVHRAQAAAHEISPGAQREPGTAERQRLSDDHAAKVSQGMNHPDQQHFGAAQGYSVADWAVLDSLDSADAVRARELFGANCVAATGRAAIHSCIEALDEISNAVRPADVLLDTLA